MGHSSNIRKPDCKTLVSIHFVAVALLVDAAAEIIFGFVSGPDRLFPQPH
jgi:hypothetical protein